MGESVSLVDGNSVGATITRVEHDTSVRAEAYRESTAWMATYIAGVLKVSNMISVIFSLLALGLREPLLAELGALLVPHAAHCRRYDARSGVTENCKSV